MAKDSTPPFSTNGNPDPGLDPYREIDLEGQKIDRLVKQNPPEKGEDQQDYWDRMEILIIRQERAERAGMEPPQKGESFQDYWDRINPQVLLTEQDRNP